MFEFLGWFCCTKFFLKLVIKWGVASAIKHKSCCFYFIETKKTSLWCYFTETCLLSSPLLSSPLLSSPLLSSVPSLFQALRARYEGRPHEEAVHLLKSGRWNLGHRIILDSLASEAIINGTSRGMISLCEYKRCFQQDTCTVRCLP